MCRARPSNIPRPSSATIRNMSLFLEHLVSVKAPCSKTISWPSSWTTCSSRQASTSLYPAGVKSNAPKLGSQLILTASELDFLLLIMQLIVHCKDICSKTTSTRTDHPNEFSNLHSHVWRKLVHLDSELLQNICKNRMGRHAKPHHKKIFEDHSFIDPRLQNRLRTGCPAVTSWEVARPGFQRPDACHPHSVKPKIVCYGSNLHPTGLLRLICHASRAPKLALTISTVIRTTR
jgi:hypothetical protein